MSNFKDFYCSETRIKRLSLLEDTKLIIMSDMHRGRADVGGRKSDVRGQRAGEREGLRDEEAERWRDGGKGWTEMEG
jgi:hypothetical protein